MYTQSWGKGSAGKVLEVNLGGPEFDSQNHVKKQLATKQPQTQQHVLVPNAGENKDKQIPGTHQLS